MRFSAATAAVPALALAASVSAQANFSAGLLDALNGAGFTTLASVISQVAETTEGAALVNALPNGNLTVFAPTNAAFSDVASNVTSNATLLTEILSYHVLQGFYTAEDVANAPAHTIARTLLSAEQYAMLPQDRNQALVLTVTPTNLFTNSNSTSEDDDDDDNDSSSSNSTTQETFQIMSNLMNITASTGITYENIRVVPVDTVIPLPPTLSAVATEAAPQAAALLQSVDLVNTLEMIDGITIFVPNDAAVALVQSDVAALNTSSVTAILGNHVINGTVVYSTEISDDLEAITVSGGELSFMTNDTGVYVTSGDATARIVMRDIVLTNGVAHVIDGVLVNTATNPTAAESAASVAATASATADPGVGPVTTTETNSVVATETAGSAGFVDSASRLGIFGSVLLGLAALV